MDSSIGIGQVSIGLDGRIGLMSGFGDVFDFAFKANIRNLQIYLESLSGTRNLNRDRVFVISVVLALALLMILPIPGLIYAVRLVTSHPQEQGLRRK